MRKRKAEGDPRPPGVPRITPQDIQDKEFRLSFRGYNEREVDEFLDELTEAMAELVEENRRLRERAEAGTAAPGGADADEVLRRAREEADRILREAREQAERIVREAGERAAAPAGPVGPDERRAIGAFVKREREFLQSLAALVQGHAEAVREMARRARERAEAAEAPPAEEVAPAAPIEERPSTGERPAPAPAAAAEGAAGPREPPAGVAAAGRREEPTIPVPEAEPEPAAERTGPTGPVQPEGAEGPEPNFADRGSEPSGRSPSLRELFWGEE